MFGLSFRRKSVSGAVIRVFSCFSTRNFQKTARFRSLKVRENWGAKFKGPGGAKNPEILASFVQENVQNPAICKWFHVLKKR